MTLSRLKAATIFTALLLVNSLSFATENKVALVIGNSRYASAPLSNPAHDARAISKNLRELGYHVIERENLTQKQIDPALNEFKSKLSPGAVALFFYAGHGLQLKGNNYFPSVDAAIASEEDVPLQSLEMKKILDLMQEAKTRVNLVILDAGRNNPYARSLPSIEPGLAKMNAPTSTFISFATKPDSVASDDSAMNGLYTEHLLTAMMMPGQSIEQIFKQVEKGVRRASKGNQEPWMEGNVENGFVLVSAPKNRLDNSGRNNKTQSITEKGPSQKKKLAGKKPPTNSAPVNLASIALPVATDNSPAYKNAPRVGDSYTYQKIDARTNMVSLLETEKVTQVSSHEVTYNNGKFHTDYFGNFDVEPGGLRHFKSLPDIFSADYVVGATWSSKIQFNYVASGADDTLDINLKVVGKEKITIPAGTFDAFKIEISGWTKGIRFGGANYRAIIWVAPEQVRRYLAIEFNVSEAQFPGEAGFSGTRTGINERHELASFNQGK